MNLPSITLYFREGSSDKVYQARIGFAGGTFYHVHFAYGRRGAALTEGRKTASPVTLDEAQRIYDKLVREKQAKGYTQGEDGVPVRAAPISGSVEPGKKPAPTMLPMLLNSIDESEAEKLLHDPEWGLQEKHDGRRLTVRSRNGDCEGFNKLGTPVGISAKIHYGVLRLDDGRACVLDGEAVGDVFHVFDLLEIDGDDWRQYPYLDRYIRLITLLDANDPTIRPVWTAEDKVTYLQRLRENKAEGAVFKKLNAPWSAGRPNVGGNALKFKFVETASFIVGKVNAKRSVALSLVQKGSVMRALVGNVTIPPNHKVPAVNSIVEVRYLYAFPGGSIYQPVYLGERDDVDFGECHTGQLKFKAA